MRHIIYFILYSSRYSYISLDFVIEITRTRTIGYQNKLHKMEDFIKIIKYIWRFLIVHFSHYMFSTKYNSQKNIILSQRGK